MDAGATHVIFSDKRMRLVLFHAGPVLVNTPGVGRGSPLHSTGTQGISLVGGWCGNSFCCSGYNFCIPGSVLLVERSIRSSYGLDIA